MAVRLYINSFSTKLTAQLLVAGTTANISTGDGALLAGANNIDWFIGTLRRISGYKDVAREIVKITLRTADALTIVRAQEGTTALQFEVDDQLDVDFTAASLQGFVSPWNVVAAAYAATLTVDLATYSAYSKILLDTTLTGACTFNLTNGADGQSIIWRVRQDVTGGRLWTAGANIRFGTDIPSVVLTAAASKLDRIGFEWNSTNGKADVVAYSRGY